MCDRREIGTSLFVLFSATTQLRGRDHCRPRSFRQRCLFQKNVHKVVAVSRMFTGSSLQSALSWLTVCSSMSEAQPVWRPASMSVVLQASRSVRECRRGSALCLAEAQVLPLVQPAPTALPCRPPDGA